MALPGYNKYMIDQPGYREFVTTHWSLVGAAKPGEVNRTRAREALEELCRTYWYPLYAFVRSRGYSAADAQDLTQAFFAQIIETDGFAGRLSASSILPQYFTKAMFGLATAVALLIGSEHPSSQCGP
jgi:hypothetical protein